MAALEPAGAKRRFVDLEVNEVSLVDQAANNQTFLVCKRLSQDPSEETEIMNGNKATEPSKQGGAPATQTPAVDVTKGANAAPAAAPAPAATASTPAPAAPAVEETEVEKATKDMVEKFKALGMTEEVAKKAAAEAAKCMDEPMKTKTKKAADAAPAPAAPASSESAEDDEEEDGGLDAVVDAIQKGKRFTPKRMKALKAAVDSLQAVLSEVGEPSELPKGNGVTASGVTETAPTQKSAAAPAPAGITLADIQSVVEKAVAPVAQRLEAVEKSAAATSTTVADIQKSRLPPTSAPADGTDTTATQKNKNGNGVSWKNVL